MESLFNSHQSRHFDFDVVFYKALLPICTLSWRVNLYVSRQKKVQKGKMKVQWIFSLLSFCSTDDNSQYWYFHTLY